jgi:hypothetical protein
MSRCDGIKRNIWMRADQCTPNPHSNSSVPGKLPAKALFCLLFFAEKIAIRRAGIEFPRQPNASCRFVSAFPLRRALWNQCCRW